MFSYSFGWIKKMREYRDPASVEAFPTILGALEAAEEWLPYAVNDLGYVEMVIIRDENGRILFTVAIEDLEDAWQREYHKTVEYRQSQYRRYRNRLDEVLRKKNPTLEELKEVAPLKRACKKLEREIAQAWDNEN